jgi:predicted membrane protein
MAYNSQQSINYDDYIDSIAVFGGVKKSILSKDFKGGEIINVFGSTELDFTRADINGTVVIDISQAFGKIKITVPGNWSVVNDISQILAQTEDKRRYTNYVADNEKILVLEGTSICAAVKIVSAYSL